MKRACELCKRRARIHCESDQASLCWDCDAKVHSANFLVARHSRNLLCRVCQSPTRWSASGSKLEPTFSVCRQCANGRICVQSREEDEGDAAEEEEGMAENHIAPWSPPTPASGSSWSSEAPVRGGGGEDVVSRKRCRLENDRPPDDHRGRLSSHLTIRPQPSDTTAAAARVSESGILESLRRFHRQETGSGAEMPEFRTLSDGPRAIDLNSDDSS